MASERGRFASQVIIVNGPPGAGKTSVTAELRLLLDNTVAISGDALRGFAPADARRHLGGGATHRAAGVLARAYLELGALRVIFDYPCLRAAHFRAFGEALPVGVEPKVFTLWPALETLLERESRAPKASLGAADYHREMARNLGSMGEILDAAALTPALAARFIHEQCLETPHL
ncbi:MAG TPA: AAA family ATPase [Polyangiaceae bacterium]|nr:AAA family ATPase [Polyangiaceae bacterium]